MFGIPPKMRKAGGCPAFHPQIPAELSPRTWPFFSRGLTVRLWLRFILEFLENVTVFWAAGGHKRMRKTYEFSVWRTASLLVLLALVALPAADAGTARKAPLPPFGQDSAPCEANIARADYLPGMDVDGRRVAPADVGGGYTVELRNLSVNPVVPVGHGRHRTEMMVQGAKLAQPAPACARIKHRREPSAPARPH